MCTESIQCDDGIFCNGAETCVSGVCQSGTGPCATGETCDEATDTCGVLVEYAMCQKTPPGQDSCNTVSESDSKVLACNGMSFGANCGRGGSKCQRLSCFTVSAECGDGTCNGSETFESCPVDCDAPVPTPSPTAVPTQVCPECPESCSGTKWTCGNVPGCSYNNKRKVCGGSPSCLTAGGAEFCSGSGGYCSGDGDCCGSSFCKGNSRCS